MPTHSDLIYDVGLFDGEDTAYYLFRGYRVLAIDANPIMVERARVRFANQVADGRVTLLNIGISEQPGTATFWVSDIPEWSSFDEAVAGREGKPHRPVSVPTQPFSEIVAKYGIPHYMKIDIEGNDALCLEALKGADQLPQFVSVECECVSDLQVLTDNEALYMLNFLRDLGYSRFKMVYQGAWIPVHANPAKRLLMRIINSAACGRLRAPVLDKIAQRYTEIGRIAALNFPFHSGSSGPWGYDIPCKWMNYKQARGTYLRERRNFFASGQAFHLFWCDWHATH